MEKDMNMQDKEFDDLFQSKLDNFEIEPSAQVWQNIDAELDGKKRSRAMFPWLSIAASIIILIAAAVLFIPKKGTEDKHHPKNKLTAVKVKPTVTKPVTSNKPVIQEPASEQVAIVKTPIAHAAKAHPTKQAVIPAVQQKEATQMIAKTEPAKTDEQPALAVTEPKKADEITNPVAVNQTPLVIKKTDISASPDIQSQPVVTTTQPVLASTEVPAIKASKPAPRKHGIRNVGDLVNLVVARVDKRKDKLIEFTDNDDDESMITGVHIGSVKIKKDN